MDKLQDTQLPTGRRHGVGPEKLWKDVQLNSTQWRSKLDPRFLIKGSHVPTPGLGVGPATVVSGAWNRLYLWARGFESTDGLCTNLGPAT